MSLLDRVKERTGSDLSDLELQAMIDAITADIAARVGPVGEITVDLGDVADPHSRLVKSHRLSRPINQAEPISIVELDPHNTGSAGDEVNLAADDFRILHGGHTIQRLSGGTNGREYFAPIVRVTYTPGDIDVAAVEEAVIQLIALDLSSRGLLKSERAGDYSFTLGDPEVERERIIAQLSSRSGLVFA